MKNALAFVAALAVPSFVAFAQGGPAATDPATVQSGTYAVETSHTRVQFAVSHVGFSTWYGDFADVTGSLALDPKSAEASKVDITIPVASISTTNAKLDGELKSADWLDAAKYQTIRFVSNNVSRVGPNRATITGTLTFHGVSRPVTLNAVFNGAGVNPLTKQYTVGFDATTTLNRSDYGVKTYVPLIGDQVDLRISAAFERKGS